ncbi:MAG: dihydropteroate synthase [Clostridiales bacterium]|nr:dihydropteroate synthase [Clostridiales bacterium]
MTDDVFRAYRTSAGTLSWRRRGVVFDFPPVLPYIAGILNVTPDSFSDGGSYATVDKAVAHALDMAEAGAAIVDVGGQSTRPGSLPVSAEEEMGRILPVLEALRTAFGDEAYSGPHVLLSLDTDKAEVADFVLSRGLADMLNDESGGDTAMAEAAARHKTPLVLMHRPAGPGRGSLEAVMEDLAEIRRAYMEAGLRPECLALDPGLGFGKDEDENLALFSNCGKLLELGSPLYIGASRKRFIGKYSGNAEAGRRLGGSLAAALWAAAAGAAFVRVHDVRETAEALAMYAAIRKAASRNSTGRGGETDGQR